MVRLAWCFAMVAVLAGSGSARVEAEESGARGQEPEAEKQATQPLHEQIDQLIEAAAIGPLAPPCSDADFVRRIYLDLTGVIPTAEQARAFLADSTADKRQRLIDELLASPAFVRHMTLTLDVMHRATGRQDRAPQAVDGISIFLHCCRKAARPALPRVDCGGWSR